MKSRRDFLQKISASALALPLVPSITFASAEHSKEEPYQGPVLRVAIMGLGSYGTRVADAMQSCKAAKLVGVISGTPSKINDWQTKYNIPEKNCYNYENFDNIKNNPDIDAVYVITPNGLHKDRVVRRHGVELVLAHVFIHLAPAREHRGALRTLLARTHGRASCDA